MEAYMNIKKSIVLTIAATLITLTSCTRSTATSATPTTLVSSTRSTATATAPTDLAERVAGEQYVQAILDSLQPVSGWTLPLPPTGGQKPRILTQAEKAKILEIASAVPIVEEIKRNKDILSVDANYIWIGWNGHADGNSFLDYEPVADGTADLSDKGDDWYPAADFLFHSTYGVYGKVGINVAINLETGNIVWLGGYTQFPVPQRIPYPSSTSSTK